MNLRRFPSGRVRQPTASARRPTTIRSSTGLSERAQFFSGGRTDKRFESDPVRAANGPLVCSLRPNEFRAYAQRARWIRTANDSYFTAIDLPRGLPSTMQPSNIHDASWGAMSASTGGAFHPSAEATPRWPTRRCRPLAAALGLNAPPEVVAQTLPPPESNAPGSAPQ